MNTSNSPSKIPVALIAGPTASGKSALAVRLAELSNGVVINADATQVYADLRVLSARPDAADEARAPHRLFGYRDAAVACSAADWAADARAAIDEAASEGRLPILVGGTGLYLRTLLFGIAPVPDIDLNIRADIRSLPAAEAYAALLREDPAMGHLHPHDSSRIARALEVVRSTGASLSEWQRRLEGGIADRVAIAARILLPPRDWLRDRCDRRFEAMLEQGALQEVEGLLARRLPPDLPAMRAIGVPEIVDWLEGRIDRETMVARGQAATRQYAKRQYTWFRHQPPAEWHRVDAQLDNAAIEQIAIKLQSEALTP